MKKTYSAPEIAFESFAMSTSIAACKFETNHSKESQCGYKWDFETVIFLDGISGCDIEIEDGDDAWDGYCYHNYSDNRQLFGS